MADVADLVIVMLGVIAALTILLYAIWLLTHRLRRGESKRLAFREWLRNVLEAIWGL
jgi:hypothetical protein